MIFQNKENRTTDETVCVSKHALEKIAEIVDIMEGLEFYCSSCGIRDEERGKRRTIVDFLTVPKQHVTGSSCQITDIGNSKGRAEADKKNLLMLGIAHGHGHYGAWHSDTDNQTFSSTVLEGCHKNNEELFYELSDIIKHREFLEAGFESGLTVKMEYPPHIMESIDKLEKPAQALLLVRKCSRVSSIVVNKAREIYAEIRYRNKNNITGETTYPERDIAWVEEIENVDYMPDYDKEFLIKDLVSKVRFGSLEDVPNVFNRYHNEFLDIPDNKRFRKFGSDVEAYLADKRNEHRDVLNKYIEELDDLFAERLKLSHDVFTDEMAGEFISDLIAHASYKSAVPDWLESFIDEFIYEKSRFRRKKYDKDSIVKKYLDELAKSDQKNKSKVKVKFSLKRVRQLHIDSEDEEDFETEPAEAETRLEEKIEPITLKEKPKELTWLDHLEKLYSANKNNADDELGLVYGFGVLADFAENNPSIEAFRKIERKKAVRRTLEAMRSHEFEEVHENIVRQNYKLDSYKSKKQNYGYHLAQIRMPKITPDEVYDTIKDIISAEVKSIIEKSEKISIKKLPMTWAINSVKKISMEMLALDKDYRHLSKSAKYLPDFLIEDTALPKLKEKIDSLDAYIQQKFLKGTRDKIRRFENKKYSQRLLEKYVSGLEELAKCSRYAEQVSKIKEEYERAKNVNGRH